MTKMERFQIVNDLRKKTKDQQHKTSTQKSHTQSRKKKNQ